MRTVTASLLFLAAATAATLIDRVAVTVGHEAITEGEVLEDIRIVSFLNGEPPDFNADARRKAANRLVDQYLIQNEIGISRYPQPSEQEVDRMLESFIQSRFHGDAAFQQALKRYGITEPELKAHLRRQLAAIRFTDQRFTTETPPRPQAQGEAERAAPGPSEQHAAALSGSSDAVDQRLEQWLKEARGQTRIVFKKEAFE